MGDTADKRIERTASVFVDAFGYRPSIAARAPGRVNIIGEHVDYNDGLVLPMAIDLACIAVGGVGGVSGVVRVVSADLARSVHVPAERFFDAGFWRSQRSPRDAWAAYAVGACAYACTRLGKERTRGLLESGFDLALAGDVPIGAGLSSSAALEVASALCTFGLAGGGSAVDPFALVELCRNAEHEYAGVPCGIMDQIACVFGRHGHALLIDCRTLHIEPTPIPNHLALIVIDTGVHHDLAAGEYASRRESCRRACVAMGASSLRDVDLEQVEHAVGVDALDLACARHVVREIDRTQLAAVALRAGDGPTLARLMLASHVSLRDDYRVSSRELDVTVEVAMATPGVLGARMTGAGFGGSVVALVDAPSAPTAVDVITRALPGAGLADARAWRVRPADGAVAMPLS
ncbi:MAG: galactokinase [Phycisphaeraceae bacterium]|nr:galactokinase [Phycisphaeraceae bacterium]